MLLREDELLDSTLPRPLQRPHRGALLVVRLLEVATRRAKSAFFWLGNPSHGGLLGNKTCYWPEFGNIGRLSHFNIFLGLDQRILKAIQEAGYTEPTPIQAAAIPEVLAAGM